MPRHYDRKTARGTFTKDAMQMAVEARLAGSSLRKAASDFGVNYKTLERYVKLYQENGNLEKATFGYGTEKKRIFSDEHERILLDYILEASSIYYGLTLQEVRSLAYEVAVANSISVPDSWMSAKSAGEDWLVAFRQRHQDKLSLRNPEATSLNRAQAFNKTNVNLFFDNLDKVMDKHKFRPECIWNIDETGCSTVQTPQRQLAKKGEKRVGSIVSHEKGCTVTLCGSVNAIGNSMPPFLIFPRVNVQDHWKLSAPTGTYCDSHPKASGWMTSENFLNFLDHFKQHAKPTKDRPVLMILDNHASHCSQQAINFCRQNHITLLSFPPHCSHEMQPLDKSVYGPFQLYYDRALEMWCKDPVNAGKLMSIHSVPHMVSYAFPKAFTPANIIPGFRSTGIYPMDRHIFPDEKFMPTYSTDRPAPVPNTTDPEPQQPTTTSPAPSTANSFTSPKEIRPFPKAPARKEGECRKRKAVTSAILTSTPEKLPSSQSITISAGGSSKPKRLTYDSDSDDEANATLDNILTNQMEDEDSFQEEEESDDHIALQACLSDAEVKTVCVDDFIFFKCEGKKSTAFYTGIVRKLMDAEGDFEVEYLKRSEKVKNKFVSFNNDETWSVHKKDIISLLTKSHTCGTQRTKSGHVFIEDIVKYAV